MKYIVVTGGVLSGVGKGVISSSTGVILQSMGYNVTLIKIDPYINLDAGTLSPYDHGEVFVLSDGAETDLDLGNYERFLNISLTSSHSITTGKVYDAVIKKERGGGFLGKTVQIVPHVTDYIEKLIVQVAQVKVKHGIPWKTGSDLRKADVCIIELGGTVGDIESTLFLEALRQLKIRSNQNDFMVISVDYIPELNGVEHKTKPIQNSVKNMRSFGIKPDVIVCRCQNPMDTSVLSKISNFCEVDVSHIYHCPTLSSVYQVPSNLAEKNFFSSIAKFLNLQSKKPTFDIKTHFLVNYTKFDRIVEIAVVGKYVANEDCYMSVSNALKFSGSFLKTMVKINWIEASDLEENNEAAFDLLRRSHGILVPGGFGVRGVEGKIMAIKYARENNIPFFGICLGFQTAVIEFCRSVLGVKDATSEEFSEDAANKVIIFMMDVDKSNMGGTMRLGDRETFFFKNCRTKKIYGNKDLIHERHRHRYEVNKDYVSKMERNKFHFVGRDNTGERMEVFELEDHPFFVGVQFHPEFNARPAEPHCLFTEFVKSSMERAEQ